MEGLGFLNLKSPAILGGGETPLHKLTSIHTAYIGKPSILGTSTLDQRCKDALLWFHMNELFCKQKTPLKIQVYQNSWFFTLGQVKTQLEIFQKLIGTTTALQIQSPSEDSDGTLQSSAENMT